MPEVISTVNLTKAYGKINAVDNLNLSVAKGDIFGFLRLNAAGKTTTIRLLLGLVKPTSGETYLQGKKSEWKQHRDLARCGLSGGDSLFLPGADGKGKPGGYPQAQEDQA